MLRGVPRGLVIDCVLMNPNNQVPGPEARLPSYSQHSDESEMDPHEEVARSAAAGEGGFAPSQSDALAGEFPEDDARSVHMD